MVLGGLKEIEFYQAEEADKKVLDYFPKLIVTSTLSKAMETAEIVKSMLDSNVDLVVNPFAIELGKESPKKK